MITGPALLLALLEGSVGAAVLALTALGLSLVFGVMRVINIAHGEFVMLGAVVAWWCSAELLGAHPLIGFMVDEDFERVCREMRLADGTVWPAELIVVDQGTNTDVATWIERLRGEGVRTTHVASRETGIAAAMNRGFERVGTPVVATTPPGARRAATR